jgi:hypothetical protein
MFLPTDSLRPLSNALPDRRFAGSWGKMNFYGCVPNRTKTFYGRMRGNLRYRQYQECPPANAVSRDSSRNEENTMYDNLPNDPVMLLSFINTNLRDHFPSFEELTQALQVDGSAIVAKLKSIDYEYDPAANQFI